MTTRRLTVYLAGPMTGRAKLNRPAFAKAERELAEMFPAARIVNPAALLTLRTWEANLRRDLRDHVLEADILVTLPGARKSKGARLEMYVCRALGTPVVALSTLRRDAKVPAQRALSRRRRAAVVA
jgi:hypothetical protein